MYKLVHCELGHMSIWPVFRAEQVQEFDAECVVTKTMACCMLLAVASKLELHCFKIYFLEKLVNFLQKNK